MDICQNTRQTVSLTTRLCGETFNTLTTNITPVFANADKLFYILLDLLYTSERSKQFVWDVTGDVIINNLLKNNEQCFLFPCKDMHGQIEFAGEKFTMSKKEVKVIE